LTATNLGSLLRRHGPMPARRAAMTTAGVARALEAAHARDLVHSDIRPAHVMITQDGRVKVTDFGVSLALVEAKAESKRAESTPGEPADDSPAESAGYSTPEQGAGRPGPNGAMCTPSVSCSSSCSPVGGRGKATLPRR